MLSVGSIAIEHIPQDAARGLLSSFVLHPSLVARLCCATQVPGSAGFSSFLLRSFPLPLRQAVLHFLMETEAGGLPPAFEGSFAQTEESRGFVLSQALIPE